MAEAIDFFCGLEALEAWCQSCRGSQAYGAARVAATFFAMIVTFLLAGLASFVNGYGPHHPRGSHVHYRPPPSQENGPKLTQDMQLLHDEEHIKEDLSGWMADPETNKMTPQELEFHYFKVHDFDNNTKLDGLEILQAIQHTVHSHDQSSKGETSPEDFQHYVELIDRVLEEDDLDQDGYLSYIEYVVGRQRDEKERNTPK